jgi:hypothetical protein
VNIFSFQPTTVQIILFAAIALGVLFILSRIAGSLAIDSSSVGHISWGGRQLGLFERDVRRAKRQSCRLAVLVNDRYSVEPTAPGHVLNISDTGACISTYANLYLGGRLISKLTGSFQSKPSIEGEIVWVRPEGHTTTYGIRFL